MNKIFSKILAACMLICYCVNSTIQENQNQELASEIMISTPRIDWLPPPLNDPNCLNIELYLIGQGFTNCWHIKFGVTSPTGHLEDIRQQIIRVKSLAELEEVISRNEGEVGVLNLFGHSVTEGRGYGTCLVNVRQEKIWGLDNLFNVIRLFGSHSNFTDDKHSLATISNRLEELGFYW